MYNERRKKQRLEKDSYCFQRKCRFATDEFVNTLWKECIVNYVHFPNFASISTEEIFHRTVTRLKKEISSNHRRMGVQQKINFKDFDEQTHQKQNEYASCFKHDIAMANMQHRRCRKCQSVSLAIDYVKDRKIEDYHCRDCSSIPDDFFWTPGQNKLLPVWYNEMNEPQYNLPSCLIDLRLGEQLLIQRLSCFIPIVHIKNGVFGLKGHCCCFRQDITHLAKVLPRMDVQIVRVVKEYSVKTGSDSTTSCDIFKIRREKVLAALRWLKKHHKGYAEDPDLIIDENNLSWMDGKNECELPSSMLHTSYESIPDHEASTPTDGEPVCPLYDYDEQQKLGKVFMCYKRYRMFEALTDELLQDWSLLDQSTTQVMLLSTIPIRE